MRGISKKEIVDQTGHLVGGAGLTYLMLKFGVTAIYAVIVLMLAVYARELKQHWGSSLGKGSYIDLTFRAIGSIGAVYLCL